MKPRVIVDPFFRTLDEIFSPDHQQRLHDMVEVVWGKDDPMPSDLFIEEAAQAKAIICADWNRYGNSVEDMPNLRGILTVSGGLPLHLDYEACFARSIHVLSAAPAFARQVAEFSLGMALAATREIVYGDQRFREGEEEWLHAGNRTTFMLYGQPVGFIGFGSIARALFPLLQPFGVSITAYDPWLSDGYLQSLGVQPADLETTISQSRVIFVLAAPTQENKALLSREVLELIQPGAVLVLVSRAHVVDFDALTELVKAGRFKAAIDVFPYEPFPAPHPIRNATHAILSAHRAGSVREGLWEIGEMVLDDLEMIVRDLPPLRMQRAEPELVRRYAPLRAAVPQIVLNPEMVEKMVEEG